jgi:Protein of unknown function (DUF2874).
MKNLIVLIALFSMVFFGACGHKKAHENVKGERKELKEADERREFKEKGGRRELKEADERKEYKEKGEREELKVPEKFLAAFKQKFPEATEVEWGSESKNELEAEFTMNGKKMSASFDITPVWTETETEISEKELSAAVLNTLKAEFAGYEADKIEIIESPDIKGFEIGLKNGEKAVEVVIDNTGKVIKKADMKEEKEKEELEKEK